MSGWGICGLILMCAIIIGLSSLAIYLTFVLPFVEGKRKGFSFHPKGMAYIPAISTCPLTLIAIMPLGIMCAQFIEMSEALYWTTLAISFAIQVLIYYATPTRTLTEKAQG